MWGADWVQLSTRVGAWVHAERERAAFLQASHVEG